MSSLANLTKEPIVLQFEEQERKFSPKRRHKEEEEEEFDQEDVLDEALRHKDKLQRKDDTSSLQVTDGIGIDISKPIASIPAPTQKNAYEIPCILGPATNSRPSEMVLPSSDRSSRNIAFLCARIAEELKKKGPQTRDELSATTGFARQRICTVISVFKAIGLVNIRDSNTRRSEIEWNDQQAKVLPNVSAYVSKILNLRNENKDLKAKEQELVRKLVEKRQTIHSSFSTSLAPPLLSLMSPPTSSTIGLEDEDKFGTHSKHMGLTLDSGSGHPMSMLSGVNKATEGF